MPSVNITIKWPNGKISDFYSPSTIVYEFFKKGQQYSGIDFLAQAEKALNAASERVRVRYGFACSSAMDTLSQIQLQAEVLKLQVHDVIEIIEIYNID